MNDDSLFNGKQRERIEKGAIRTGRWNLIMEAWFWNWGSENGISTGLDSSRKESAVINYDANSAKLSKGARSIAGASWRCKSPKGRQL